MIFHGGTNSYLTIVRLQAVSSTISGTDCPLTVPVFCQTSTVFDLASTVVDFSHSKAGSPGHLAAICPSFLQLKQHIGGFLAGSSASLSLDPASVSCFCASLEHSALMWSAVLQ